MKRIKTLEHFLSIDAVPEDALSFVLAMRELANENGIEYPTTFTDFLYNIEAELQNFGYLDENFNIVK